MSDTSARKSAIVRGGLRSGHHDALIEFLGNQQRRIGNHMILTISEACQERWPMTMADFNHPVSEAEDVVQVKLTVREDLYPGLYQRYKTLSPGIRTVVFLNMLNRYADMSRVAPEMVAGAMNEMESQRAGKHGAQFGQENPAAVERSPAPQEVPIIPAEGREPEAASPPEPGPIPPPVVDPLMSINTGL